MKKVSVAPATDNPRVMANVAIYRSLGHFRNHRERANRRRAAGRRTALPLRAEKDILTRPSA
jgi:hypothetical protein